MAGLADLLPQKADGSLDMAAAKKGPYGNLAEFISNTKDYDKVDLLAAPNSVEACEKQLVTRMQQQRETVDNAGGIFGSATPGFLQAQSDADSEKSQKAYMETLVKARQELEKLKKNAATYQAVAEATKGYDHGLKIEIVHNAPVAVDPAFSVGADGSNIKNTSYDIAQASRLGLQGDAGTYHQLQREWWADPKAHEGGVLTGKMTGDMVGYMTEKYGDTFKNAAGNKHMDPSYDIGQAARLGLLQKPDAYYKLQQQWWADEQSHKGGVLTAEMTGDLVGYAQNKYVNENHEIDQTKILASLNGAAGGPPTAGVTAEAKGDFLKVGSLGTDVEELQARILRLNPDAEVGKSSDRHKPDGNFGERTQQALIDLQKKYGLDQTGKYDKATQERLQTEIASLDNPKSKAVLAEVKEPGVPNPSTNTNASNFTLNSSTGGGTFLGASGTSFGMEGLHNYSARGGNYGQLTQLSGTNESLRLNDMLRVPPSALPPSEPVGSGATNPDGGVPKKELALNIVPKEQIKTRFGKSFGPGGPGSSIG